MPCFDEIFFNVGVDVGRTGELIGDSEPGGLDPSSATRSATRSTRSDRKVYQGAAAPGTRSSRRLRSYHWKPPAEEAYTFDLARAGQLLDEAGYKKGADGLRTMPDGSPIGTLRWPRASTPPDVVDTMDFFKEWLAELGIEAEVAALRVEQAHQIILDGTFDAFQWGWYVEPDPDSILSYMTCGQRGGWSDSWYCDRIRRALRAADAETDRRSAPS